VKANEMREMPLLFDFYGGLLSERQRELCESYYNEDLSLSEIAANTGITRQGVRDSLRKAEEILQSAEESLGFLKAWRERQNVVARLEQRLRELGICDEAIGEALAKLRA